MFKILLLYVTSFAIIGGCLFGGIYAQQQLSIPLPGSIVGMLILFSLLSFKIVPERFVKLGATLFIRYMLLLFVPTSVGLMEHFQLLEQGAVPILLSIIVSTAFVLIGVSFTLDRLLKKD